MLDEFVLQGYLDEMDGRIGSTLEPPCAASASASGVNNANGKKKSSGRRSSVSDGADSLSRSASDSSVSNPTVNHNKGNMNTSLHG